jgi:hypothetical protein
MTEKNFRKARKNLEKQYDGHKPFGSNFRRPKMTPQQLEDRRIELENGNGVYKGVYRNPLGKKTRKYLDVDTYYSTTREYPRRLVVQATPEAIEEAKHDPRPRHWRQSEFQGQAPLVIRLAEFCSNPLSLAEDDGVEELEDDDDDDEDDKSWICGTKRRERKPIDIQLLCKRIVNCIASLFCNVTMAWIIEVALAAELVATPWSDDSTPDDYTEYKNVHWNWPRHAINPLDQDPDNKERQSEVGRLTIPRALRIRNKSTGLWETKETRELRDQTTHMLPEYILLSFSRENFPGRGEEFFKEYFDRVAEKVLHVENKRRERDGRPLLEAYWQDTHCVSQDKEQKTKDINTICDAVRCAKWIYVVLPHDDREQMEKWGQRIWTMPEVLLAVGKIGYCACSPDVGENGERTFTISQDGKLTNFYDSFWPESRSRGEEDEDALGLLINHYTGTLKLSDLQLFTCAIQALARRYTTERKKNGKTIEGYTTSDLAYAAMGLLAYRITPNDDDDNFQAIARLSLVNDSEQLLERLVCLWPCEEEGDAELTDFVVDKTVAGSLAIMHNIANRDQYSTHLWDIHPLCDVVGIASDEYTPTVILDRCRAIPIEWKKFPRMKYVKDFSKLSATIFQKIVYWGSGLIIAGFGLFYSALSLEFSLIPYTYNNSDNSNNQTVQVPNVSMYLVGSTVLFGFAWIISWFSPRAVRKLCNGGGSVGLSCHLVGFEGTMSLRDIEISIFGNCNSRLSYSPSSSIFSKTLRYRNIRMGQEPEEGPQGWKEIAKKICKSPRDRLFTIVDTGDLTVTVIAAERPPVVALICGRDGGMLRALLCSWRFENNCLYRECVVRMRSSLEDQTTPMDWLKVSLATQGDVSREISKHRSQNRKKQADKMKPHISIHGFDGRTPS